MWMMSCKFIQSEIHTSPAVPVYVCWSAWMPSSRCRSLRRAFSGWILGKCHSWRLASYSWHFDWPQTGHRLRGPPTNRWGNSERRKDREAEETGNVIHLLLQNIQSSLKAESFFGAQRELTGINTDVLIRQYPQGYFSATKRPFISPYFDLNNNLK